MSRMAWLELFALGGTGPYAWGAFLIALALVVVELVLLRARRRNILRYLGAARRSAPMARPDAAGHGRRMSPPGRPKGESLSAQREGSRLR